MSWIFFILLISDGDDDNNISWAFTEYLAENLTLGSNL